MTEFHKPDIKFLDKYFSCYYSSCTKSENENGNEYKQHKDYHFICILDQITLKYKIRQYKAYLDLGSKQLK